MPHKQSIIIYTYKGVENYIRWSQYRFGTNSVVEIQYNIRYGAPKRATTPTSQDWCYSANSIPLHVQCRQAGAIVAYVSRCASIRKYVRII